MARKRKASVVEVSSPSSSSDEGEIPAAYAQIIFTNFPCGGCNATFTSARGLKMHQAHCTAFLAMEGTPQANEGDEVILPPDAGNEDLQQDEEDLHEQAPVSLFLPDLQRNLGSIFKPPLLSAEPPPEEDLTDHDLFNALLAENPSFPFANPFEKDLASAIDRASMANTGATGILNALHKHHPGLVEVKNLADIGKKLLKVPLENYVTVDITHLFPEAEQTLLMRYKPCWSLIKELFRHPSFKGKLVFRAVETLKNGERVYGSLEQGLWWNFMQSHLDDQVDGDFVITPYILYSDQAQAQNFGSVTVYPVYLTIGNIFRDARRTLAAYKLGCFLPVLKGTPEQLTRWGKTNLKGRILHHCLSIFTESLREISKTGVRIPDGEGKAHLCFPMLAYYQADWPETKKVTLTKDTNRTKKPCNGCEVSNEQLGEISDAIRKLPIKTHDGIRRQLEEYKLLRTSKAKSEFLKSHSLHPYDNAFWDLASNIYVQLAPDLIHQFFLGIVKTFLEALVVHLLNLPNGKEKAKELDNYMRDMPRWQHIMHFSNGISSLSYVTADSMKSVLFQLPHAIYGLRLPSHYHDVSLELLTWYITFTTSDITIPLLQSLQQMEDKIAAGIHRCNFGQRFETVKNHTFCHYAPFAVLFEEPEVSSTQAGEMKHKSSVKINFRLSNKKDHAPTTMANREQRLDAQAFINPVCYTLKPPLHPDHPCQLTRRPSVIRTVKEVSSQPGFDSFQAFLAPFLVGELDLAKNQVNVVFREIEDLQVRVHTSLFLNVKGLQKRVVSSPSFYSKERRDCIAVEGEDGTWYARVHLLFTIRFRGSNFGCAFIRYFGEPMPAKPFLRLPPCNLFQVISIASVKDVAYIAPNYRSQAEHHVNHLVHLYEEKKLEREIDRALRPKRKFKKPVWEELDGSDSEEDSPAAERSSEDSEDSGSSEDSEEGESSGDDRDEGSMGSFESFDDEPADSSSSGESDNLD